MTGTPEDRDQQQHPAPPLPGPVEDVDCPMTIIGGPPAEDAPRRTGAPGTSLTGFFSTVRRTGRWEVPPVLSLVQGFSEVRLDLREAVVRSPVVEVRIYGGFSDCTIIVPPGVDVEWGGGASLFSDEKSDPPGAPDPRMWRLRILHYGAFSEITVRTLGVGEVEPKWWRRFA